MTYSDLQWFFLDFHLRPRSSTPFSWVSIYRGTPSEGHGGIYHMGMKEGEMNDNASIEAWIEDDMIVIVIQTECGGYYEKTIDVADLSWHFDFVPEGC